MTVIDMDKTSNVLPDVQNLMDGRNIPIDRVGIRGLTVPLQVQSIKGAQPTVPPSPPPRR